jgi:hypothetical protein
LGCDKKILPLTFVGILPRGDCELQYTTKTIPPLLDYTNPICMKLGFDIIPVQ